MKKNSDKLKSAFLEAAKVEISSLPEENKIIRPCSEDFENRMNDIIGNDKNVMLRKRSRLTPAVIIAAALTFCLMVTAAATTLIGTGSVDFNVEGEEAQTTVIKAPEERWDNQDGTFTIVPEAEKEGEIDVLTYDGGEIKAVLTFKAEENPQFQEHGIIITLNGIRQTFTAECDGKKVQDTILYAFKTEPLKEKKIRISFTPSIGKAGDELQFMTYLMYNPSFELKEKGNIMEGVSHHHEIIDVGYKKLIMKVDAPTQTIVAKDFTGKSVVTADERVIRSYKEMESDFYIFAYTDIDKFFTDDGFYTKMFAEKSEKQELTLSLLGNGGTYKISFYINNELMPVFDGSSYIDIVTSEAEQTNLKLSIDTTKLEKVNSCYILYEEISDSFQYLTQNRGSYVYKIVVG